MNEIMQEPYILHITLSTGTANVGVFGCGSRPLLLIPGLSVTKTTDNIQAVAHAYRALAETHTVYLVERRNEINMPVTIMDLANDVKEVMEQLCLRDVDMMGVSQGGMIAGTLACIRPTWIHKLVLACTSPKTTDKDCSVIRRWIRLAKENRQHDMIADMVDHIYSERTLKRGREMLIQCYKEQSSQVMTRFVYLAEACLTHDILDELHRITSPTLVIVAGGDRVIGGDNADQWMAGIAGAIRYDFDASWGHGVYDETPKFKRVIADFLQ